MLVGSYWEFGANIRPSRACGPVLFASLSAHSLVRSRCSPGCSCAPLLGPSVNLLCQMFALLVGTGANKAYYDAHMGFHKLSQHNFACSWKELRHSSPPARKLHVQAGATSRAGAPQAPGPCWDAHAVARS